MTRKELLDESIKCVCTDREQQYGSPENNFTTVAILWEIYLQAKFDNGGDGAIDSHDVGIMMALLKIARIASGQVKADNYIDACGYLACAGDIATKETN